MSTNTSHPCSASKILVEQTIVYQNLRSAALDSGSPLVCEISDSVHSEHCSRPPMSAMTVTAAPVEVYLTARSSMCAPLGRKLAIKMGLLQA